MIAGSEIDEWDTLRKLREKGNSLHKLGRLNVIFLDRESCILNTATYEADRFAINVKHDPLTRCHNFESDGNGNIFIVVN